MWTDPSRSLCKLHLRMKIMRCGWKLWKNSTKWTLSQSQSQINSACNKVTSSKWLICPTKVWWAIQNSKKWDVETRKCVMLLLDKSHEPFLKHHSSFIIMPLNKGPGSPVETEEVWMFNTVATVMFRLCYLSEPYETYIHGGHSNRNNLT